eukprot:6435086-Amphidinium_carterae.1
MMTKEKVFLQHRFYVVTEQMLAPGTGVMSVGSLQQARAEFIADRGQLTLADGTEVPIRKRNGVYELEVQLGGHEMMAPLEAEIDGADDPLDLEARAEELGEHGGEEIEGRRLALPRPPTKEEVLRHRTNGHQPHRSWCKRCVKGRGRISGHGPQTPQTDVPKMSIDYMFLGAVPSKSVRGADKYM